MRCSSLELRVDGLLRHLGLVPRHLERRPVGRLGLRLHLDGRREDPVVAFARRQLVLVLAAARPGSTRARVRRVPEPAADVALDRLLVDALLADALHEQRHRHLALAEAGDADALGEVVRRVLDGVMHVVRRDIDREPDLVVGELLRPVSPSGSAIEPDLVPSGRVDVERRHPLAEDAQAVRPEPVDEATLRELFDLARFAPNHKLTQPWRFRVLGPETRPRIEAAAGEKEAMKLRRAPDARARDGGALGRSAHRRGGPPGDGGSGLRACCSARPRAGSPRTGGPPLAFEEPASARCAGCTPTERVVALIHLGPPVSDSPAKERLPLEEVLSHASVSELPSSEGEVPQRAREGRSVSQWAIHSAFCSSRTTRLPARAACAPRVR